MQAKSPGPVEYDALEHQDRIQVLEFNSLEFQHSPLCPFVYPFGHLFRWQVASAVRACLSEVEGVNLEQASRLDAGDSRGHFTGTVIDMIVLVLEEALFHMSSGMRRGPVPGGENGYLPVLDADQPVRGWGETPIILSEGAL